MLCPVLSSHKKDPSALPKLGCLALPSLLSTLQWHYSGSSHLILCMVGCALRHLELGALITLPISLSIFLSKQLTMLSYECANTTQMFLVLQEFPWTDGGVFNDVHLSQVI